MLRVLEQYMEETSKLANMNISMLVTGERILQAKMEDIVKELHHNTMVLPRGIEQRTEYLEQELEWVQVLISKVLQLINKGKIITDSLGK